MKRSTARWTTAFAAAALIGVPVAGWSQTPPAATSQPPAAQQPADAPAQHGAAEHIQKAEAALNDIPTSTLPARAKSRVEELKRHLNSLEKSAASSHAADTTAKPSSKPKDTWAKDVAAIDKTLTELLGPAAASGAAAPPAATGTTGQSKSDTLTIDDTTKAKLMEVRQHVTAFATSMSGAGSTGAPSPNRRLNRRRQRLPRRRHRPRRRPSQLQRQVRARRVRSLRRRRSRQQRPLRRPLNRLRLRPRPRPRALSRALRMMRKAPSAT